MFFSVTKKPKHAVGEYGGEGESTNGFVTVDSLSEMMRKFPLRSPSPTFLGLIQQNNQGNSLSIYK